MSIRTEKIGSLMQKEISKAIASLFPLEQSGVFTILKVDVLSDLTEARVYISTFGGEDDFFDCLEKARNKIQHLVTPHVPLRKTPKIIFYPQLSKD